MKMQGLLSVLALMLFLPLSANAAVYKCKDANGKVSYRDVPCQYQNAGNGNSVKVKPQKRSGSAYSIVGSWCQYARAASRSAPQTVSEPRQWRFNSNGTLQFSVPLSSTLINTTYQLSSDYIQTGNGQVGNWFIADYSSDAMTLSNSNAGARFLRRGVCQVATAQ